MPNVAVITEALSPDFYFPVWYRYYASQFGSASLYVVSPGGSVSSFADYKLGGVIVMPPGEINETKRSKAISQQVASLLSYYDVVIRTDTDEFLLPDPRDNLSLKEYVDQLRVPYVTAMGLDVFQHVRDAPVDYSKSILVDQRRFVYATSSMCKTALTSIPIEWGPGFHFSSVFPHFASLYLFHLKRADIQQQMGWNSFVSGRDFSDPAMATYYAPNLEKIENFHKAVSGKPVMRGWDGLFRPDFLKRFFDAIKYDPRDRIYRGSHFVDESVCELPKEFSGLV